MLNLWRSICEHTTEIESKKYFQFSIKHNQNELMNHYVFIYLQFLISYHSFIFFNYIFEERSEGFLN